MPAVAYFQLRQPHRDVEVAVGEDAARRRVASQKEEVVVVDGGVPLAGDEPADGEHAGRQEAQDADKDLASTDDVGVVDRVHPSSMWCRS